MVDVVFQVLLKNRSRGEVRRGLRHGPVRKLIEFFRCLDAEIGITVGPHPTQSVAPLERYTFKALRE
jgi:hypothetical protein